MTEKNSTGEEKVVVFQDDTMTGYVIDFKEGANRGQTINDELGLYWPVHDIPDLIKRVKEYLKANDIRGYTFASEVLHVPSCFFSTLLNTIQNG